MRLGATIDVEHSHVRFLGNLMLNLWDCGGQENFMASYFESQKGHIFAQVHVLIYVFDISSLGGAASAGGEDGPADSKDSEYFVSCLKALQEHSKNVKVFCLIHKMDLVEDAQRDTVFEQQRQNLQKLSEPYTSDIACFPTSIWDASLYRAWSAMVHSLIPNVATLESQLSTFCQICRADEVVLFERATFLVISHTNAPAAAQKQPYADAHRFEKISNIVKQFKCVAAAPSLRVPSHGPMVCRLSCAKSQAQFEKMEVHNSRFTVTRNGFCIRGLTDPVRPRLALVQMRELAAGFHRRLHVEHLPDGHPVAPGAVLRRQRRRGRARGDAAEYCPR